MKPDDRARHALGLLVVAAGLAGVAGSTLPDSVDDCAGDAGADKARCKNPERFPGCREGTSFNTGTASGTVRAGSASMGLNDALTTLEYTYKVDVDPVERGCIARLQANIFVARERGATTFGTDNACLIDLTFDTNGARRGVLAEVSFYANSFCPGFLDEDEGYYRLTTDADVWFGGATHVENGDQNDACVEEAITLPSTPITLRRDTDSRTLSMTFEGVTLYGSFRGNGQTQVSCPTNVTAP
jgi:hypothetical protein